MIERDRSSSEGPIRAAGERVVDSGPGGDDDALRALLERGVAELHGSGATIAGIRRTPAASASSYAAEVIRVELTDGESLGFFLKDLGVTRVPKDHAETRRERELFAYRDVLADSGLGTARYFGSVWHPPRERFWLLLELVTGTPVRERPFDAWLAAAAWLGRLQGFFVHQRERARACELLVDYSPEFLWSRAELALHYAGGVTASVAESLAASVRRYERAVPALTAEPPTLVHGHYRPYNILVDSTRQPKRVCPVDWERLGIGPPAYDFAYLAEGFDSERLDMLGEAYRAEARASGVSVPEADELRYMANGFRVHRMLSLLASSAERGFTPAEVVKVVTLVGQLCESL